MCASGWILLSMLAASTAASAGKADELAVLERQARAIDVECTRLEAAGRAAVEAGQTSAALSAFETLIARRAASPYLGRAAQALGLDPGSIDGRAFLFMQRVETGLRDQAMALAAYAQWRAGRARDAQRTLSSSGARRAYAPLIAAQAGALFERAAYAESARAYAAALEAHRAAEGSGPPDEESARLVYNRAMAESIAGRTGVALDLLREVQRTIPDYRRQDVAARIEALAHRRTRGRD
jgi:tetratricopeptide (TPR) repeat protein